MIFPTQVAWVQNAVPYRVWNGRWSLFNSYLNRLSFFMHSTFCFVWRNFVFYHVPGRSSVIGTVTVRGCSNSGKGQEIFIFSKFPDKPCDPPNLPSVGTSAISREEVKRSDREPDHSPLPHPVSKSGMSGAIPTLLCFFVECIRTLLPFISCSIFMLQSSLN